MRDGADQAANTNSERGSDAAADAAANREAFGGPEREPVALAIKSAHEGTVKADGCANGRTNQGAHAKPDIRTFVAPNADAVKCTDRVAVREPQSLAHGAHESAHVFAQLSPECARQVPDRMRGMLPHVHPKWRRVR